ncbi:MAG: sulfatase-like hydrolase/transferase [Gemmatimonadetes bacterium]|jgi:arylsulfatase A-like enzyme|nr:sulfatase-like hydrolase/transferase [Gemmatimonadota bacterium]MBT7864231.1 sulfatase-like hydrolase/transferase [Gemmatimonadota bacterium]
MADRPNILFMLTDQQSRHALGAAGNPDAHTPNMDRLAATGVRFENAYCGAPVCGPSRACLLTGRMSHDHGVLVNGLPLREGVENFGQLLQGAGYETAWSGRWHLPEPYPTRSQPPPGFSSLLPDAFTDLPDRRLGAVTDRPVTDAAIDFLQQDHDQPFCLGVALCNPHDICYWIMDPDAPAPEGEHPELPSNFARDVHEPEFITWCRRRQHYGQETSSTTDWSTSRWRAYLAEYYRLTSLVDAQIGRLLQTLDESGRADDTLVVCTSDHGEGMAAHELVVKLMLYEEAAGVPLLMRGPGVPTGQTRSQLASGIDILPTLCDAAGVELPEELSGHSLLPLARDPRHPGREAVVTQLYPDTKDLHRSGRLVRSERHKYICFNQGDRPEMLFDLVADPGERQNLAGQPAGEAELRRHRVMLQQWMAASGDPFQPLCS